MCNMIKINSILKLESLQEREVKLDEISDEIEYGNLHINQELIVAALSELLNEALNSSEYSYQESLFNLCSTLLVYGGNNQVLDLAILNSNIERLKGSSLEHAILILGFSKNKNYISTLEKFLSSNDIIIKTSALEALSELNA